MSLFTLRLELTPVPEERGSDSLTFGLSLLPAISATREDQTDERALLDRIRALRGDLTNGIPDSPTDVRWTKIEQAFQAHLPELFPWGFLSGFASWSWSGVEIALTQVSGGKLSPKLVFAAQPTNADDPRLLGTSESALYGDSVYSVRRAILLALMNGPLRSATPEAALAGMRLPTASDEVADRRLVGLTFPALMSQAAQWPAPIPHRALDAALLLRAKKDAFAQAGFAPAERVYAVATFTVGATSFALPEDVLPPADPSHPLSFAYSQHAPSPVVFACESSGFVLGKLLTPGPRADTSFVDPFTSLWLAGAASGEAATAFGANDWQQKLPSALASAADFSERILEALRIALDNGDGHLVDEVALRMLCASLRDLVGYTLMADPAAGAAHYWHRIGRPGTAVDAPAAVQLVSESWAVDARPDLWSLLEDGSGASNDDDERQRLALLTALIHDDSRFVDDAGAVRWIESLRAFVPGLATLLPSVSDMNTVLSAEEPSARLERFEAIHRAATAPESQFALLLGLWRRAADQAPESLRADARAFLADWAERDVGPSLKASLAEGDWIAANRKSAALDLVARFSRWRAPTKDDPAPYLSRATAALKTQADLRWNATSVARPTMPSAARPPWLDPALERAALDLVVALGIAEANAETPQLETHPSPLVLQLDTLSDDGDAQGNDEDVNGQLRGYSALIRRVGADWSAPHQGTAVLHCWKDDNHNRLADGSGEEVLVLGANVVAATHGMRQVTLRVDERSWLDQRGVEPFAPEAPIAEPESEQLLSVVPRARATRWSARLPALGFGLEYEAAPFAITASGALPPSLRESADAPHVFLAATDKPEPDAAAVRRVEYKRRVGVNPVRIRLKPAAEKSEIPAPFRVPPEIPVAAREIDSQPSASLADRTAESAPPLLVLLAGDKVPADWQAQSFEVHAPDCTREVYARWCTRDRFESANPEPWRKWIQRIDAADTLRRMLVADSGDKAELNGFALHDPAATSIRVSWRSLRGAAVPPLDLEWTRADERQPPPILQEDGLSDEDLLRELGRAGFEPIKVVVRRSTQLTLRYDGATKILTVSVPPGYIGDLVFEPLVPDSSFVRFDQRVAEFAALPKHGAARVFGASRLRIEVATMDTPSSSELADCIALRAEADGEIAMYWDRGASAHGPTDAASLGLDNVCALEVRWQGWRLPGRPQSPFPTAQVALDAQALTNPPSLHPLTHAILWDSEGFAERDPDTGVREPKRALRVRENAVRVWRQPRDRDVPRYVRARVTALHRNAALFRLAGLEVESELEAVLAAPSNLPAAWRRALRPGRRTQPVDPPLVKLTLPLTRAVSKASNTADLLVVLNEQWGLRGGMAETLECVVEPVTRKLAAGQETRSEFGHDPIVSGVSADNLDSLPTLGPLGHTFDTDTREPLFAATSFVVRASSALAPWDFAKLSFRRVLLPELMDGYYDVPAPRTSGPGKDRYPRIALNPARHAALAGGDLAHVGEGFVSLDDVSVSSGVWEIHFGALTWKFAVDREGSFKVKLHHLPAGTIARDFDSQRDKPELQLLSLRVVAKRIEEAFASALGETRPARWEVAFYVRATRARKRAEHGFEEALEWERVGAWRGDEPENLAGGALEVTHASIVPAHIAAQCAPRFSHYVPAEWVQALADARSAAIGGQPWHGALDPSDLRIQRQGQHVVIQKSDGRLPPLTEWRDFAAPAGQSDQGLFHLLLVARDVTTSDGGASEMFVGLFRKDGDAFVPIETTSPWSQLADTASVHAYVLLVQIDPHQIRNPSDLAAFWSSAFPAEWKDAGVRILSISDRISARG